MPAKLARAELRELDARMKQTSDRSHWTKLQFNPETLKVSFTNQLQTPPATGGSGTGSPGATQGKRDTSGTPAQQFVGAGTTKLALTVYFDVTVPSPDGEQAVSDVRELTQKVAYFITPKAEGTQFIPPAVCFVWGSFQFAGLMDSLEESLEFFSDDGRPLRASLSISLSQQRITAMPPLPVGAPTGTAAPGTRPLAEAPAGSTVQGLAAATGRADDWQAIASANGIENPRMLGPGQLLDLDPPPVPSTAR